MTRAPGRLGLNLWDLMIFLGVGVSGYLNFTSVVHAGV